MSTISLASPPLILDDAESLIPHLGEFTVYEDADYFLEELHRATTLTEEQGREHSFDFEGGVEFKGKRARGRVHVAKCFAGKKVSITVRQDGDKVPEIVNKAEKRWLLPAVENDCKVYHPLFEIIDSEVDEWRGLILITGETGSGKTTALNALLSLFLKKRLESSQGKPSSRPQPHVVVVGDPIETYCFSTIESNPKERLTKTLDDSCMGISSFPCLNYTPRTLGIDVRNVEQALTDALRETPAAVVVGELRSDADFESALKFAGTGQLLLATSHNSSVIDAFRRLMEVAKVRTANDRYSLGQRIGAVVHLRKCAEGKRLPALWCGTPKALRSFVAEGPSSILQGNGRGRLHLLREMPGGVSREEELEALEMDLHRR